MNPLWLGSIMEWLKYSGFQSFRSALQPALCPGGCETRTRVHSDILPNFSRKHPTSPVALSSTSDIFYSKKFQLFSAHTSGLAMKAFKTIAEAMPLGHREWVD